MKKAARNLILGMKELPEQGGYWGLLLPRIKGAREVKPATANAFQAINENLLVFNPGLQASNRGFGFVFGSIIGCAFLSMFLWLLVNIDLKADPELLWTLVGFLFVPVLLSATFFCWALTSLCAAIPPPVVLLKEARCFYYWFDSKAGWVRLAYDELQPVNMIARSYGAAGGSTGYVLAVVDMEPGSRRIRWYLPLAQSHRNIEAPERLWEFVRRYMDEDPCRVPAIDPITPVDDARADLARLDRFLFGAMVDENHRVAKGLFPKIYVGLIGATMYWFERAGLWISRTARRPDWPKEVADVMRIPCVSSLYRVRDPTEAERLASEGRLPHLNRRWFVMACFSTAIVLAMFAVLGVPPWLPAWR